MVMKLGSGTGSLVNHVLSRMTNGQPEPQVGDGATLLHWSDRDAATVIRVIQKPEKGRWIIAVQEDHAKATEKHDYFGSQDYTYTPNPNGRISYFRFETGKGWLEVEPGKRLNTWKLTGSGQGIRCGSRETFRDPSF